jgi:multiple sugar transport system substrate-binding protein
VSSKSLSRRRLLQTTATAAVAAGTVGLSSAGAAPITKAPAFIRHRQGAQVTLRFMTHNTLEEPGGTFLKQMISEFEQANPTIKIQIEEVPNADVLTKLTAYASANDFPDLIDGQFGLASFLDLNASLDITDRVQGELAEGFFPAALEACKDDQGRILALPFYTGTDALYYRTDLFEEAGLDPNAPPTTWDQLREYAKALTSPRSGRYGFGIYGKTHTIRIVHFMQNAGPDGEMLRLMDDGKWEILVNSPDSIKAWAYVVGLAINDRVTPPNVVEMDYPANVSSFAGGNIAMLTTGPWGAQTFIGTNPEIEGKFQVAKHPTPDGSTPKLRQGSLVYGIGSTTQHPEEAFLFLKWLTYDRQTFFAANAGYGPTTLAALNDEQVKANPYLPVFVEQAETAIVEPWEFRLKEWNQLKDRYDPQFQAALLGEKSPTEAVMASAQGFQEILGDRSVLKYPIS